MRRSLGSENGPAVVPSAFRVFTQRSHGFAIDFKFESGRRRALAYADLVDTEYNPDLGGIILEGIGKRVTILGLNLIGLYEQIIDHEVGEVIERHEPEHLMAAVAKRGEPYVRELMWDRV